MFVLLVRVVLHTLEYQASSSAWATKHLPMIGDARCPLTSCHLKRLCTRLEKFVGSPRNCAHYIAKVPRTVSIRVHTGRLSKHNYWFLDAAPP